MRHRWSPLVVVFGLLLAMPARGQESIHWHTDLESAKVMAKRLKAVTDTPVLVGVGISTAAQAVEVCEEADGVVVGSAIIRRLLDGDGPEGAAAVVAAIALSP